MENIAVITGDLIDSRKVEEDSYDHLLYTLERVLQSVTHGVEGRDFDIYRGDSFQAIIPDINNVVKMALLIRLALKSEDKSFDARVSIGIGTYDNIRKNVRSSTGEAYILSGTGIDKLRNQKLAIYTSKVKFQQRIELVTKYLDTNISELTKQQSRIMYEYFIAVDKSHDSIAETMSTTRSNITQSLNKGKYQLIEEYLEMFNELVKEFY